MENFTNSLKFLFANDAIVLNIALILMPILLLVAISIIQFKDNLHSILIALIPIYIIFVFLYIFTNFTTDTNNFNSTNLSIYGAILFVLLPIDLLVIQNIKGQPVKS
ncbi:MAG: hypothetical protein J6M39_02685 [Lachnospiraceae bacterium]|nr:hypothetical protein [Lachnospiraceae bacterium]